MSHVLMKKLAFLGRLHFVLLYVTV